MQIAQQKNFKSLTIAVWCWMNKYTAHKQCTQHSECRFNSCRFIRNLQNRFVPIINKWNKTFERLFGRSIGRYKLIFNLRPLATEQFMFFCQLCKIFSLDIRKVFKESRSHKKKSICERLRKCM